MAGLLDVFNSFEGQQALGLLAAAGGRSDGAGFGQRLMEGLSQGDRWKAQQAAEKRAQMQEQMQMMQMQQMLSQAEQQKKMQGLAARFGTPGTGMAADGYGPSAPASFDRQGYAAALESIDPVAGLQYAASIQKDDSPISVAPGASLIDRKTLKPLFTAPKEHTTPAAIQEYEFAKTQGYPGSYLQFQLEQKKAGATNVSMKVDNKMGESLAGQVGPMVKETYTAAQGAVQQMDAAKRIVSAIDNGKIIAGPGANVRMTIAQAGQLLGVGGKSDAETIANTRSVIRGLSEMTLQGRKQMSGQGAITESEGKLAEKANSGDITDLTAAEIRQLANASARASKFVYQNHAENLKSLASDPNTAGLSKFYKVPSLPDFNIEQPAAQSGSVKFLGFEGN